MQHIPMAWSGAWRRLGLAATMAGALLLGGCATYFGAEVTAYHQQEPALQGLSFRFKPDADQANSLEYQTYAALVREQLLAHGLKETGSSRPDVDVTLDYSVDNGRPVNYSQPNYAYVFQGYRQVAHQRTDANGQVVTYWETVPMYGYDLVGYSTYQRTIYRKQVKLALTGTKPLPGRPARLYEGSVVSDSEDGALNNAVPLMVKALFQDFPGPNGVTRHVQVRLDGDEKAADETRAKGEGSPRARRRMQKRHPRVPRAGRLPAHPVRPVRGTEGGLSCPSAAARGWAGRCPAAACGAPSGAPGARCPALRPRPAGGPVHAAGRCGSRPAPSAAA